MRTRPFIVRSCALAWQYRCKQMLNSKNDDAYGLREIYRIQGIKLGYGRAVAIMRPPARINTAPRPNECGREPESAYLRIRSLLHSHFLPVCTALFPFNCPLRLNGTRAAPLFLKGLFRVLYPMFLGLLAGEVF